MARKIKPYLILFALFLNQPLIFSPLDLKASSDNVKVPTEVKVASKKIDMRIVKLPKVTELIIEGFGPDVKFTQQLKGQTLFSKIYTRNPRSILSKSQSISLPSAGIEVVSLEGSGEFFQLRVIASEGVDLAKSKFLVEEDDLILRFPSNQSTEDTLLNAENLFSTSALTSNLQSPLLNRAVAPPLGDIAIGTKIIPNPNLINLDGPNVSLVFKQTPAKKVLEYLLSKGKYSFAWVQDDPSFDPTNGNSGIGFNRARSLNRNDENPQVIQPLSSSFPPYSPSLQGSSEKNADTQRLITMTIQDQPFSKAFNAVLMASRLQARLENNIVYVGPTVRDTIFSSRLSRVYRLNQTTANAAASYLATLGAKVTKTSTITTAITQGASESQTPVGSSTSSTTSQGTSTSVEIYGSDIGPLLGLIVTTDDRLQTVTMLGSPELVGIAEGYLKQLDLRQRQVALTVKVLDVNLSDGSTYNNSWALRQNNNFIVNDNGKLLAAFGKYLPPNDSKDFGDSNTTKLLTTDTAAGTDDSTYSRRLRINPAADYVDNTFLDFLKAQIISKNTKILASPTLILNEYPGEAGGDTVNFGSISNSLTAGTIGRSYGNEAFVVVGTQVPVNCTASEETTVPSFTYGIKGLTFGARVMRIDDNGFVTFAISPSVTAPSEQRDITNCGTVDLLATRRLDSGTIRVRDGHTLILTGVINTTDKETATKWPIFGDLPLIGKFFRNKASTKEQNELVILVTPQILRGSGSGYFVEGKGYIPKSNEAEDFLKNQ